MVKHLSSFGLFVLLVLPYSALSEEVRVSCSKVADATERLACFDRTFPGEPNTATQEMKVDPVQTTTVLPSPSVVPPAVITQERVADVQDDQPPVLGDSPMFSKKMKVSINSRLKSVRDQDKQKMVFLLDNDQIWLQDSPRSLPFAKGENVTIKSGTVGGYLLSNETGVSTRVRRIK